MRQVTQACDDGNSEDGDGCSHNCTIEPGYVCLGHVGTSSNCFNSCGDGIVVSSLEQCDDGNLENGDGCSDACEIEVGYQCEVAQESVSSSSLG